MSAGWGCGAATQQTASIHVEGEHMMDDHTQAVMLIPVQLRLVLVVKAQQQRVEGKTFNPPAGLDGPILHVLGELQNLQPDLSVITQTQEAPQGQGQLVEQTPSAWTEDRGGQSAHMYKHRPAAPLQFFTCSSCSTVR